MISDSSISGPFYGLILSGFVPAGEQQHDLIAFLGEVDAVAWAEEKRNSFTPLPTGCISPNRLSRQSALSDPGSDPRFGGMVAQSVQPLAELIGLLISYALLYPTGYNNASVAVFEPFIVISESSVPALVRWLIHVPSDYPRPVPRASSPTNLGPGNAK